MIFSQDQYISVTFPSLSLKTRIIDGPTKLVGDPQRQLKRFFDDDNVQDIDLAKGHSEHWDQFEENARRYNVVTKFDESQYTTKLRKEKLTREQIERAEEIAESLENAPSENFHVRADRGQVSNEEFDDEEKRFSAVLGTGAYKGNSHKPQRREHKNNTKEKTPKVDHKTKVGMEFPNEVMTFTNSKKENMEITQSIEADLGLTEKKSEAKSEAKTVEQIENITKEPPANYC